MSRSGYIDAVDESRLNLYRCNVHRAIKGKRGQAFLKELAKALDEMPDKKLIAEQLVADDGSVCAIGAVCKARGLDVSRVDEYDPEEVGKLVGISGVLAAEITYLNDDPEGYCYFGKDTPHRRWKWMRQWVSEHLMEDTHAD